MKYEDEITIEVDSTLSNVKSILERNNFKVKEKYTVNDIYMIKSDDDLKDNYLDNLKHCLLIRNILAENKDRKVITYKYKEYNDKEEIVKQGKIDLEIVSIDEAKKFLEAINYEEYVRVYDNLTVYANDTSELILQEVGNHIYIEMEANCDYIDRTYKDANEMIEDIKKYNIPIRGSNYYVKKAEVALKEKYDNYF